MERRKVVPLDNCIPAHFFVAINCQLSNKNTLRWDAHVMRHVNSRRTTRTNNSTLTTQGWAGEPKAAENWDQTRALGDNGKLQLGEGRGLGEAVVLRWM